MGTLLSMNRKLAAVFFALAACGTSSEDARDASLAFDAAALDAATSLDATAPDAAIADANMSIDAMSDANASDANVDAEVDAGPSCTRDITPCVPPEAPVFAHEFESFETTRGSFTGGARFGIEPGFTGNAVSIDTDETSSLVLERRLDASAVSWARVHVRVRVKAESVSAPPLPWNGIKVMIVTELSDGTMWYPQMPIGTGSFDWTEHRWNVEMPHDVVSAKLVLGLEDVSGKVLFDDLSIELLACGPTVRVDPSCEPDTRHDEPRLRGFMVPQWADEPTREAAVDTMQTWGANHIRWQLNAPDFGDTRGLSSEDFEEHLELGLSRLDAALPLLEEAGVRVLVDLHNLSIHWDLNEENQTRFVATWEGIARRYAGSSVVWGYDLANEPMARDLRPGLLIWEALAERTAHAIHAIDSGKAIIVEPLMGGGPWGFRALYPVDAPGVVYSVHMYEPHRFTHQRIFTPLESLVSYPGTIDGTLWNAARIASTLEPVRAFGERIHAPIYVGEFSAVRWSPGGAAYIEDALAYFEAHEWDWAYHALREWTGWSLECPSDESDCTSFVGSDRQDVVRDYLERNRE